MSKFRTRGERFKSIPEEIRKGPNGRRLCRQCGKEVPKGKRTFCGPECVHDWRIRSDPRYMRQCVLKRDGGICAKCGVNTYRIKADILEHRSHDERISFAKQLGYPPHRIYETLWDANHIIPVVEGGGESGLENIETLCIPCHKIETAKLRKRLKGK